MHHTFAFDLDMGGDLETTLDVTMLVDPPSPRYDTPLGPAPGGFSFEGVLSVHRGRQCLTDKYEDDETFQHSVDVACVKEVGRLNGL